MMPNSYLFRQRPSTPHFATPGRPTLVPLLLMLATLVIAPPSRATILTFDIGSNSTGTAIPSNYGDNVSQSVVAGITYFEGNGWTPDITVDFVPDSNPIQFTHWATGYALTPQGVTLLPHALGHNNFNVPGEIVFTPSAGHTVYLLGFDIGTWSSGTYVTDIRLWDSAGSRNSPNLLSFNGTFAPGVVYSPLTSILVANGPLHLFINNLGSTGVDNIHFSQTAVPLPAAVWLLGSTFCGMAHLMRRKAKHVGAQ